jgi:hypothetical protein
MPWRPIEFRDVELTDGGGVVSLTRQQRFTPYCLLFKKRFGD